MLRCWGAPFVICLATLAVVDGIAAQSAAVDHLRRLPPPNQRRALDLSSEFATAAESIENDFVNPVDRPSGDVSIYEPDVSSWPLSGDLENVDPAVIPQMESSDGGLPASLLWEVPLANQREPRMYGKFTDFEGDLTFETAIGAQLGLARLSPDERINEGVQLDVFAVVFTRFTNDWILMTSDFRVGFPLTFATGPWQAKLSFEHTSSHLGDEYIIATGNLGQSHVHDEIVLGLARRYANDIRIYGQYAYSFSASRTIKEFRNRYDWGVEWSIPPSARGSRPFAAFDMDLRSVQGYEVNVTLQAGWQWRTFRHGRSMRLALEFYDGKSPYGQFYRQREEWIGFAIMYDW